ncbi:hypothetical protein PG994_002799 [Apiospora phragmitis]|uniref:chitinase n=1 Tax=Apiospora phragmitis TaxID=2905665 RepID=A0ABR1W663_9PEZI
MPPPGTIRGAIWAIIGLFLLLLGSPVVYARSNTPQHQPLQPRYYGESTCLRSGDATFPPSQRESVGSPRGPAHQNPAKAPPQPMNEAVAALDAELMQSHHVPGRRDVHHDLMKRDGPLYCKDGPCIDGSCCGKDSICGYGPDFCGDGCQSQCNATAMCGEFSENADMPCGMKLCCSATGWCGTTESYCHNADPLHGTLPCQAGYGSCSITGRPSCAEGSGSTNGRTVGYYQSWNVRDRVCNKVAPDQLNTTGYTHLFYSFASIDPATFKIAPAHSDDPEMMREFTKLSSGGKLQTWIAIGGFDFSDPGQRTHTTWSDLCTTKERRAAFISSVRDYMDEYGFQGVDLDWEYPGAPERGGRKLADTRNLAMLVREMRAAYGTAYGISLTLAPDYWYLRWFDAKAMEPYVDFFGFMAYDLHGSWDADVKTLGKLVRGQADIREISNNTVPLWFDGLNPAKINFGLAMYGRGYTLSDPSCTDLLCSFAGPSKAAPCTNFDGVMSLVEIKQLIKRLGITPKYLPESMMKQITWDDQWIGYDDEETFAKKKAFADGMCFGGTMVWSIDFQVPGSGAPDDDLQVVYLAPEVYSNAPAQCTPPCVMVFPPTALPSATNVSIPPYTSSIIVGSGDNKKTVTVTVNPPAITTNSMGFFNINATSGQETGTLQPTQSIDVPPVVTTITDDGGLIYTRTLYLPPWPLITLGPPPSGGWTTGGPLPTGEPGSTGGGGNFPTPVWPPSFPPTTQPPSQTTDAPGPEPTVWPDSWDVFPVDHDVDDDGEDDDGDGPKYKTSCDLWFFFVCIKWEGIVIGGWEWNLPTGVWGPGPPALDKIKLPPNIRIDGQLPPWPKITIGPGGKPTHPPKPADCEPAEASLCMTTSSFATTVSNGATRTTATQVKSTCATITGCHLRDVEATTSADACTLQPTAGAAVGRRARDWFGGECDKPIGDAVVLPYRPDRPADIDAIRAVLDERKAVLGDDAGSYEEFTAPDLGFTAYFWIKGMGRRTFDALNDERRVPQMWCARTPVPEIRRAYFYEFENGVRILNNGDRLREKPPLLPRYNQRRMHRGSDDDTEDGLNQTLTPPATLNPVKWGPDSEPNSKWHLGQISTPPNVVFQKDGPYTYSYDDSLGKGQTIFILDDGFVDIPAEFGGAVEEILLKRYGKDLPEENDHGPLVAAFAGGRTLGVAKNARMIHVQTPFELNRNWPIERFLEALINVANRCIGTKDTTVVNMSWGLPLEQANIGVWQIMGKNFIDRFIESLMKAIGDKYGTVFVAAAGNDNEEVADFPALFGVSAGKLPNLLVVGGSTKDGTKTPGSNYGDLVNVYAPGMDLDYPPDWPHEKRPEGVYGTSFGKLQDPLPHCIGRLVAYIRAHPDIDAQTPSAVKAKVLELSRTVRTAAEIGGKVKVVWNGQSGTQTCGTKKQRRGLLSWLYRHQDDDDDSCPLPGQPGSGSPGNLPLGPPVSFTRGPAGPSCTASCGQLCSGFWCGPTPTGPPPELEPTETTEPGGMPTNCVSSTTTMSCRGAGVGKDCHTATRCLATGPLLTDFPTLPPNTATAIPTNCVSTTTWTSCGLGGGGGHAPACVTGLGCAATRAPEPTTTTTQPSVSWEPHSGFPAPTPLPSKAVGCNDGCPLEPSIMEACDIAAQEFVKNPGQTYGTGDDKIPSSVCVDGTDKSNGNSVGCRIGFFEEDSVGSQCLWKGSEAAQWYSNIRSQCATCGYAYDTYSFCEMMIIFEAKCERTGGGLE